MACGLALGTLLALAIALSGCSYSMKAEPLRDISAPPTPTLPLALVLDESAWTETARAFGGSRELSPEMLERMGISDAPQLLREALERTHLFDQVVASMHGREVIERPSLNLQPTFFYQTENQSGYALKYLLGAATGGLSTALGGFGLETKVTVFVEGVVYPRLPRAPRGPQTTKRVYWGTGETIVEGGYWSEVDGIAAARRAALKTAVKDLAAKIHRDAAHMIELSNSGTDRVAPAPKAPTARPTPGTTSRPGACATGEYWNSVAGRCAKVAR
jgi:hypothetical protein